MGNEKNKKEEKKGILHSVTKKLDSFLKKESKKKSCCCEGKCK
ncbi:MAG: hypothetical protein ABIJ10_04190 [Candidatus Micrarchaeota archaeon]